MKIAISFLSAMVFARSAHSEPLFEAGATGTNPSNKAGKEGKKLRKPGNDQCEDSYSSDGFIGKFPTKDRHAELEKRYGKIIKKRKDIDKNFCVKDNHLLIHSGAVTLATGLSPVIYEFYAPSLTEDELKLVCLTVCEDNPICDYVSIVGFTESPRHEIGTFPTGSGLSCELFSADESIGGSSIYIQSVDPPISNTYLGYTAAVAIKKKGTSIPPAYEDGPMCNVTVMDPVTLDTTIACANKIINDPAICEPLLTQDLDDYILPGVLCVSGLGGDFKSCAACLLEELTKKDLTCTAGAARVCAPIESEKNIIKSVCGAQCKADTCLAKLQQTILCALGSRFTRTEKLTTVGCVNSDYDTVYGDEIDAFTCPDFFEWTE